MPGCNCAGQSGGIPAACQPGAGVRTLSGCEWPARFTGCGCDVSAGALQMSWPRLGPIHGPCPGSGRKAIARASRAGAAPAAGACRWKCGSRALRGRIMAAPDLAGLGRGLGDGHSPRGGGKNGQGRICARRGKAPGEADRLRHIRPQPPARRPDMPMRRRGSARGRRSSQFNKAPPMVGFMGNSPTPIGAHGPGARGLDALHRMGPGPTSGAGAAGAIIPARQRLRRPRRHWELRPIAAGRGATAIPGCHPRG